MPSKEQVLEALAPVARRVAEIDLAAPDAEAALAGLLDADAIAAVGAALVAANDEGWLAPRQATDTLRFGRLAKPGPETAGMSIDVVDMRGAGAGHTHPNGEASLCFALEGAPTFMGQPPGWVLARPGSHHVPEVLGGRMLIVYFLPRGAMEWD
jgi:hypothetical protein